MKKNPKQIVAILTLVAIILFIIMFFISALFAAPGESGNRFYAMFFGIIALPILGWLIILCIGRFQNKHTIAEFFPKADDSDNKTKTESKKQ